MCLGDAKVNKQILLARGGDGAMGGSANGSGGGKENDPLSDSILRKRSISVDSISIAIRTQSHWLTRNMEMAKFSNRQPFPEIY